MKRLLVVIQQFRRGGVEIAAVNFASNLDKEKYAVTYYLQNVCDEQDKELLETVKSNNSEVIIKPESCSNYFSSYKHLIQVLEEGKYDIIHSHVMFYSGLVMRAGYKSKVPIRVSHSHGSKWNHKENLPFKVYKTAMKYLLNKYSTAKLACSEIAGEYMYGVKAFKNNGRIIQNGVDFANFSYSDEKKALARKTLNLSDNTLIIGHIGTIYRIKNQSFIVRILSQITDKNSVLLLVGEEVDVEPIKDLAKQLGVLDRVFFLGQRNDIAELLCAFDIMIFPSLNEGLPVSLIEAQATKLPCLISDSVSNEVKFNSNVSFLSLNDSIERWVKETNNLLNIDRNSVDISRIKSIYDIKTVSKKLENEIYIN